MTGEEGVGADRAIGGIADHEGLPPFELVIVSYRSRPQVEGLLANLPADLPVCVVDNAGGVDGLEELVKARLGARYVDGGGSGFARGANQGARSSPYEVVIFVNPDSRPTIEDYREMVRTVVADVGCASASATMVSADGAVELGTAGWEPSLRRALVHAAGIHKVFPQAGLFARPRPHELVSVDWTSGACMAVRRGTFFALGGFDERYFVYSEDVAFGRAVREHGMYQVLRTDLLVPHASGGSGAPSAEMMRLRGASMARYVSRHNSLVTAGPIRLALALGYLARVVEQLVLVRDRARAGEHWAYVVGLFTGRATVGGKVVTDRG